MKISNAIVLFFYLLAPFIGTSQIVDRTGDIEEGARNYNVKSIGYLTYERGSIDSLGSTSGFGLGVVYSAKKTKIGLAHTWGRLSDIPEGTLYPDAVHRYRSFSVNVNYFPLLGKSLQPILGTEYSFYSIGTKEENAMENKVWERAYGSGSLGPTFGIMWYFNSASSLSVNGKYAWFVTENIADFNYTPDHFYRVDIRLAITFVQ